MRMRLFALTILALAPAAAQEVISGYRIWVDIVQPATPSAGRTATYAKGGKWCSTNSSGAETCADVGGAANLTVVNAAVKVSSSGIVTASGCTISASNALTCPGGLQSTEEGTGRLELAEGSAPEPPSAGEQALYFDSADHYLKRITAAGTIKTVEPVGVTRSIVVKGSDGANCILTVSNGLITATTCP